ncbi:hypothetical protein CHS0354_021058 [Potamilus streckersoni]|uniref:Protein phosphatase 1 regulatory subunit n=1 Tax=Potamilus streckersoni TaxID=2493646 RepID=A0AAE0SD80_9BIVA|nr:hypothetical protein CHS0354_021058 [Potamilus streckersoni]
MKDLPMLQIVPKAECTWNKMPVDFAAYLLSSSPPASSYELLTYALKIESAQFTPNRNGFLQHSRLAQARNSPAKSIIIHSTPKNSNHEFDATFSTNSSCTSGSPSPTSPSSPGKARKKVSFADHKGFALATVRIMSEPSDVPPRLGPEVFASLTLGATAVVTDQPPLELNFSQPASDYLAFRDKLEKSSVSLENVILRDYSVIGTVKVKNVSFQKRVFVRYTFDSWETMNDVDACFVASPCDGLASPYDTFSFEFTVPTNLDKDKKSEFAIGFETPNGQHWDNNNGKNYGIRCSSFKQPPRQEYPVCKQQDYHEIRNWTEYASWNHVDSSTPYW